jgi:potassium efflux system protein
MPIFLGSTPLRHRVQALAISLLISWLSMGAANAAPIRIAFAGPTSGPSAEDGLSAVRAIELVFERVNAEGGINGRSLVLDIYDDQNTSSIARENAPSIVAQNETIAVIGHNYSTCSIAAGKVYAEGGIAAVSTASTSVSVTRDNDWYFRVIFNDTVQGQMIPLYVRAVLGARSFAIVHETDAYGAYLAEVMAVAGPEAGLPVDAVLDFDPSDPQLDARMDDIVAQLVGPRGPPAIVMAMQPEAGVKLVKRLRELEYKGLLIAADALASQAFADGFDGFHAERERKGFYSNGIFASTPFLSDASGKLANDFKQQYIDRYEREPDWYAAFANDAAEVLVGARRRRGN